jgi:hypothetical protein
MKRNEFLRLIECAVSAEALKKLIFSKPKDTEIAKISGRLVSHRGRRTLALELSLPGNTVSHRNVSENMLSEELLPFFEGYAQVNLITTAGDAEWKSGKKGEVILGGDALMRRLTGASQKFESAIESLDKKKNYVLRGDEEFLKALGISSADGRVHDKKQGKFRQINRFLEHIEDLYPKLPSDEIVIYDLCSGKSYLSFAVYYYLTEIKKRKVYMLAVDLKRDVILWCEELAKGLGYGGMHFKVQDISTLSPDRAPDMVISLHACDVATDIVLEHAARLGAGVILSTPCCHRYLRDKINSAELGFITDYPHVANKLAEAATDALRILRLRSFGYEVTALELTDPENTPKNTLIKAVKNIKISESAKKSAADEYNATLKFLIGDGAPNYLSEFLK